MRIFTNTFLVSLYLVLISGTTLLRGHYSQFFLYLITPIVIFLVFTEIKVALGWPRHGSALNWRHSRIKRR